jgi:phosphonate transport system substrate-binding protein
MQDDDNNANRSIGRRKFLAGTGVAAAGGISGCIGAGGTEEDTQSGGSGGGGGGGSEQVTILLTPANPTEVKAKYTPMKKYLEDTIDGLDVQFRVPTDYSAVRPALESEQAEMGMDDITLISEPDLVDVMGTAITGGSAFYFSVIFTQPDSDVQELTDIEGKSMSFADPLSTSGSIYALYELQQAGLDIGEAPTGDAVDFDGNWADHQQSVNSVINGRTAAGASWTGEVMPNIPRDAVPQNVADKSGFVNDAGSADEMVRPINWSEPIPKQPIYARATWDSPMKDKIEQALLSVTPEEMEQYKGSDYERTLPFKKLKDTTIDNYQPVIKRVDALGIELA